MMGRRLTLVSAPAGYGKTTLVSTWLRSTDHRFTWLSLDSGDDDLARFFAYLVAALQRVDVGIELTVQDLLEEPQLPPVDTLVTALINDIAATPTSPLTLPSSSVPAHRLVLVLDDYHVITELTIHEAVDLLVERLVPHMHLVIASRQDPPLALSRLRGRGQVTEIRQHDLRFTSEEATAFLKHSADLDLAACAPLQELLEIAQRELERGEGHEQAAQNATDNGALYDWARATRAFTRSQVRARQVSNALVPPPSKPEDLGL